MKIAVKTSSDYDSGSYGVVFFLHDEGKAVKVFKVSDNDEAIRKTFLSEVAAYESIQSSEEAKAITPAYFGPVIIEQVLDVNGLDVSQHFCLDMAYVMSLEKGDYHSKGDIRMQYPEEVARVDKILASAGARYLKDYSVIIDDGVIKMVVDFGVEEIERFHRY